MVKDLRERPAECIFETNSDITLKRKNMLSDFGYSMLYAIPKMGGLET